MDLGVNLQQAVKQACVALKRRGNTPYMKNGLGEAAERARSRRDQTKPKVDLGFVATWRSFYGVG